MQACRIPLLSLLSSLVAGVTLAGVLAGCGAPAASGGSAAGPKGAKAGDDKPATEAGKTNVDTKEIKAAEPAAQNPLKDPAAVAALGSAAPDFTLTAADGSAVTLSQHIGKVVVLEWFNPECPFVKAAHGTGGVLATLAGEQPEGVVWLAINSGAAGKQGHGADKNVAAATEWSLKHPILLDETGAVGKAYAATNTPHVFVIDAKGTLTYRGAPDNAPMGEVDGEGEKQSHLVNAITAVLAGSPPAAAETKAYGCSVKYAS